MFVFAFNVRAGKYAFHQFSKRFRGQGVHVFKLLVDHGQGKNFRGRKIIQWDEDDVGVSLEKISYSWNEKIAIGSKTTGSCRAIVLTGSGFCEKVIT